MAKELIHEKGGHVFYIVSRILVGLLFAQHGAQKLLGWFGKDAVPLFSQMGAAGAIELIGGLMLALGMFTVPVAVISAVEMLFAYITVHVPTGWVPIENNGELALLYFAAFFGIIAYQSKRSRVDRNFFRRLFRK